MTGWVVRPVEIDDVPIVTFALYSDTYSDYELRRVADEILHRIQSIPDTGRAFVVGGRTRQIRVLLQPDRMAARGVSVNETVRALKAANVNVRAGTMDVKDREIVVDAGPFIQSVRELEHLVVAVSAERPVYLEDVARVKDGPEEVISYTRYVPGPQETLKEQRTPEFRSYPQVTIAVAKRKGPTRCRCGRSDSQGQ